jgi:hypothetical protein
VKPLEARSIGAPGEPIKAALRSGAVVIVTLRLGVGEWEPLYAICGVRRVSLPRQFCWTIEAIGALEMTFLTGLTEGTDGQDPPLSASDPETT